jgi:lipoprotein-releasing system ATP-binding protein
MIDEQIIRVEQVRKELTVKNGGEEIVTTILPGISFEVERGEFTAITGPSGSGKTTLLYLVGGLDKPTSGKVFLDGEEISAMTEDELADMRNAKLGFVYQFHFLLPEFTAVENVMMPMLARRRWSVSDARKRATELLSQLDLSDKVHNRPNQLSGGQQQRVAIARALANHPMVLLADEPTGNLDSKNAEVIYRLFAKLNEEMGQTIVVVTHDEHFASETKRILHILDGQLDSDRKLIKK